MPTDVRRGAGRAHPDDAIATEMQASRLHYFLRGRRDHLDLTIPQVAQRLGITERSYGNWERGRVKEWTDEKLYHLGEALEMSEYQLSRLFLYAVGRAPQPHLRDAFRHRGQRSRHALTSFLGDYKVMMNALSLPSFVIDRGWDIKMSNQPYRDLFRDMKHHPAAMPTSNFLRFGLFHPDARSVLVDHHQWQLAILAQLASSLEIHGDNGGLQAIRRDVYLDAGLRDAYLSEMPDWVMDRGADLVHQENAVCELRHPDPSVGLQGCRLVEETPRSLQALGLTRLTLVLVGIDERPSPNTCGTAASASGQTGW